MLRYMKGVASIGLAAATIHLAGCGEIVPYSPVAANDSPAAPFSTQADSALSGGPQMGGDRQIQGFFSKLNLTDAQKQQLKAMAQKYHPQAGQQGDHLQRLTELKNLVLADPIDPAALKAFISAHLKEATGKIGQRVDRLAEMRAVLTEAQRDTLAASLSQAGNDDHRARFEAMGDRMTSRLADKLSLTADQKTAFDALRGKLKALRASHHDTLKPAFANFARTGDKEALKAAFTGLSDGLPMDDAVAFVASLSHDQRQKAVDLIGHFMPGRHGGHGFMHQ